MSKLVLEILLHDGTYKVLEHLRCYSALAFAHVNVINICGVKPMITNILEVSRHVTECVGYMKLCEVSPLKVSQPLLLHRFHRLGSPCQCSML
jgi:hypothetical protein